MQVECVVSVGLSDTRISLKNVAEITGDADENHQPIEDRDSTPKNLTTTQKANYKS